MLSDHEQRVLAELEGLLDDMGGSGSPATVVARPFRDMRPSGWAAIGLTAAPGVFLLMWGAPVGGAALLLAAGLVLLVWRWWPLLGQDGGLGDEEAGRRSGWGGSGPGTTRRWTGGVR